MSGSTRGWRCLVGCPCALVISTPAAIAAGLAAGARRGLLIKGGAVLETLGKITLIALDKTGTLTEGRPKVTDIVALQGDERQVLADAAALDATSSHPIAKAVLARANAAGIRIILAADVAALGGKGITGSVDGRGSSRGRPGLPPSGRYSALKPRPAWRRCRARARLCPCSSSTTRPPG